MSIRRLATAALAVLAAAGATAPVSAQSAKYSVSPAGPADPRNSYVPQAGAVFIVDNEKGEVVMCFPDNKDSKPVVVCTPATKLP